MATITDDLDKALTEAPLEARDKAAVALAKAYAAEIDLGGDLAKLGPALLAVLTSLGMTPAARGVKGGESGAGIAARLDEFTTARARKRPA